MQVAGFTCRKATTTVQGFGMGGGMMRMGGAPGGGQGGRPGRDSVGGRQGGRDSMVARMMNQKQQVVAWYTEEIPSSAGPGDYFGLPGLILYLDIDEGTIVFSPKKLEPLGTDVAVKAPTKGNKITRKEYFEMMRSQMQGMSGRPGGPGGGTFMIRQ
jgi:GLPGLI family protein